MRNLHQILLQEYGLEVQHLFRDWERLRLKETDYKNHTIFTLRCLHKDLVPVSIKLKSTLKTDRAKKIVRKAEKDLIQARIKSINSILNNVAKQTEECRSQLVSIISTGRLRECQGFIDKVGEINFNKVKLRQIKKFQNLVNKKEGNITWSSNNNNNNNLPQAGNNLMANRQAGRHSPSSRGRQQHNPGKTSPSSWGRRRSKFPPSKLRFLFSGHISPPFPGRKQFLPGNCSPSLPGNCSPSLRGRKQFSPSNCSPSSWWRKQFYPSNCSPSSWGR